MIEKIFNYKIIIGASIVIFSLFTSGCVTTNEYNNYRNINESTETYDVKIEFHDDLENPYYRISTESMALSKNDLTQKEEFFISITRHKYESNPRVVNASVAIVYIGKIYRKMKPEMKMKINDDIASFTNCFYHEDMTGSNYLQMIANSFGIINNQNNNSLLYRAC